MNPHVTLSGTKTLTGLLALGLLTACGPREEILPGERLDIRALSTFEQPPVDEDGNEIFVPEEAAPVLTALSLPTATTNADWTHRNGGPGHFMAHPQLAAAPERIWSANVGSGNSRKHAITSDPVVADGRVFAMDSRLTVKGFSTDGTSLWSRNLTPEQERTGSGGGLALGAGQLFATTGFGDVVALDPQSGTVNWTHRTFGAISAPPVVVGDTVVAVTRANVAVGLDVKNGRIRWEQSSGGNEAGVFGAGAPAAAGGMAIVPFPSGEIVGALARNGIRAWSSAVSGGNAQVSRNFFGDISSDPVVDGTRLYVANQAGRMAALDRRSGARIWTVNEGSYTPVWPAGDSVFVITDRFELKRLSKDDGSELWSVELPGYKAKRDRRIRSAHSHFGPVIAGGQIWVASSDGQLRAFDPKDGTELGSVNIPGGAASQPAIAGGRMFILSENGTLHAYQ